MFKKSLKNVKIINIKSSVKMNQSGHLPYYEDEQTFYNDFYTLLNDSESAHFNQIW